MDPNELTLLTQQAMARPSCAYRGFPHPTQTAKQGMDPNEATMMQQAMAQAFDPAAALGAGGGGTYGRASLFEAATALPSAGEALWWRYACWCLRLTGGKCV